MGNFRQHVNRKRKERERKRNRKNSKQKFKKEHGGDSMKTIANALRKTLVIGSAVPPDRDTQGENSTPSDGDRKRAPAPISPKLNRDRLNKSKSQLTVDEVLKGFRQSHHVNPGSLKTIMKVNDDLPKRRNLLKKKKTHRRRMKDELKQTEQVHLKNVEGTEGEAASEGSDGDDESTSRQSDRSAAHMGKLKTPSKSVAEDEEKVDVAEIYPSMKFSTGPANKALQKMRVAQFRMINEMLYTSQSEKAVELFTEDPKNFDVYHEGYRHQVGKWLMNPLDRIIAKIKESFPSRTRIADLGCGEAKLAITLKPLGYTVHSFDLIAANPHVRMCNIRDVPLNSDSVDVAVMCLSLMGTDMGQFVLEANRILVTNGELLIAEVESRIPSVEAFVKVMKRYGFSLKFKDTARVFHFFNFRKTKSVPKGAEKNMDNVLWLKPCLYKKR